MSKRPSPELIDKDNPEWTAEDFARAMRFEQLPASVRGKLAGRTRGPQKALVPQRPGCLSANFSVDTINRVKITCDPAKNAANIVRRGLPFDLVADLDWSSATIVEDTRKTYGEHRYRAFGYIGERLHVVVFTPRGSAVHVISFRKANGREVKRYG